MENFVLMRTLIERAAPGLSFTFQLDAVPCDRRRAVRRFMIVSANNFRFSVFEDSVWKDVQRTLLRKMRPNDDDCGCHICSEEFTVKPTPCPPKNNSLPKLMTDSELEALERHDPNKATEALTVLADYFSVEGWDASCTDLQALVCLGTMMRPLQDRLVSAKRCLNHYQDDYEWFDRALEAARILPKLTNCDVFTDVLTDPEFQDRCEHNRVNQPGEIELTSFLHQDMTPKHVKIQILLAVNARADLTLRIRNAHALPNTWMPFLKQVHFHMVSFFPVFTSAYKLGLEMSHKVKQLAYTQLECITTTQYDRETLKRDFEQAYHTTGTPMLTPGFQHVLVFGRRRNGVVYT